MAPKAPYDIAIVGGGLVGMSMACALASLPLSVVLIEAVPPQQQINIDYDVRALALSHSSCEIYKTLGLFSEIQSLSTPIHCVHVSEKGSWGLVKIAAKELGLEELGVVIPIPYLLKVLSEQIQKEPSIHRKAPAKVEKFFREKESDPWTIQLQNQETLSAKFLIGADGIQSPLRQQLELPHVEKDYEQWALVANVTLNRPHHQVAYERFTPQGPMALLPLYGDGNTMTLVCTLPKSQGDFFKGLSDRAFLSLLQQWFGYRIGRFEKMGKRDMFPLRHLYVKEQYEEGIVLIGNAAHQLHPIAAQGFNLGLRDVAFLAEIIADTVKKGEPLGSESMLKHYASLREGDQGKTIRFAHGLLTLFAQEQKPVKWARHLGMVALETLPGFKKWFAHYGMGARGHVSKLARGVSFHDETL